jgi:endonuclease-3
MGRKTNPTTSKSKIGKAGPRAWPARDPGRASKPAMRLKSKAASRPRSWSEAEIEEAFRRLRAANPEPRGELQYIDPYTLLIAVVLSAQATDAGVNKATPALFAAADTPEKMVALGEDKVRDLIRTIGLFRTKAKNVIALSEKLITEHGGMVPPVREALEALPGSAGKPRMWCSTSRSAPTRLRSIPISFASAIVPGSHPAGIRLKSRPSWRSWCRRRTGATPIIG